MRRILLVFAVLVFLVPTLVSASVLKVDVILGLLDAGVSDVSIQRYVERNGFTFDLSAEDLKALKKAGASDALIEFLQDREPGAAEEPGYAVESPQGDEGATAYLPPYYSSYGLYLGYPYSYDYFFPYYGPSYYYPYFYGGYYPYGGHHYYYGGGHRGRGSGVYSYWYRNHSDRSSARPNSSGRRSSPGRSSSRGGHGGGHGRRR